MTFMPFGKTQSTGLAIWQDIKVLIVACTLFCFAPLGLILMWSWEVWSPKVRKVVTWLGLIAIALFLACMMICGHGWKGSCGMGGWTKGYGMHGGSHGGWGSCDKDGGKLHCERDEDEDDGEDEDDDDEDEDEKKLEAPAKSESK